MPRQVEPIRVEEALNRNQRRRGRVGPGGSAASGELDATRCGLVCIRTRPPYAPGRR